MRLRRKIRVFCIDSHPVFVQGVEAIIRQQADMESVGIATSCSDALIRYRHLRPDVTLMCMRLPDCDGISCMAGIRQLVPRARVIMLTAFEGEAEVQSALAAGARGFMSKSVSSEDMFTGIRVVHEGRRYLPADIADQLAQTFGSETLSAREIGVLRELAEGYRNRDIGAHLGITEKTVKGHVQSILRKLDAQDRTQAVSIGIRRGIIRL